MDITRLYYGYLSKMPFLRSGGHVLTTGGKKVLPAHCHFNINYAYAFFMWTFKQKHFSIDVYFRINIFSFQLEFSSFYLKTWILWYVKRPSHGWQDTKKFLMYYLKTGMYKQTNSYLFFITEIHIFFVPKPIPKKKY